ncbi:MAG: AAA family ATPase [Endomicrobium sp.]|jgi:hypothetical protein|nr:AAA family ATPase [Endomicrobium sp.]
MNNGKFGTSGIFIDRTRLMLEMIKENTWCVFNRPVRFGYTTLISMFREYFLGNVSSFEGTDIESEVASLKSYDVYMIDFSSYSLYTRPKIRVGFDYEATYDLKRKMYKTILEPEFTRVGLLTCKVSSRQELLHHIISNIKRKYIETGIKIVFLFDFYDKPIMDVLSLRVFEGVAEELLGFYSTLIGNCKKEIEFAFFVGCGVSNKRPAGVKDLSVDVKYNTLLGVAKADVSPQIAYFLDEVGTYNFVAQGEQMYPISIVAQCYKDGKYPINYVYSDTMEYVFRYIIRNNGIVFTDLPNKIGQTSVLYKLGFFTMRRGKFDFVDAYCAKRLCSEFMYDWGELRNSPNLFRQLFESNVLSFKSDLDKFYDSLSRKINKKLIKMTLYVMANLTQGVEVYYDEGTTLIVIRLQFINFVVTQALLQHERSNDFEVVYTDKPYVYIDMILDEERRRISSFDYNISTATGGGRRV